MKVFNTKKEFEDYIDKKHIGTARLILAKMNDANAELNRLKQKVAANPPPGLSEDDLGDLESLRKVVLARAQNADQCVARVKNEVTRLVQLFNDTKRTGGQ